MTKIEYNRQDLKVTIKGHSGYAEQGKDIVCASISSLAYALGKYVDKAYREGKAYFKPTIKLDEGDAEISITIRGTFEYETRLVFDAMCEGFKLIANTYPDNVEFNKSISLI